MNYQLILEKLEKWLKTEKQFYDNGDMTSIAESIHGSNTIQSVIDQIEELRKEAKMSDYTDDEISKLEKIYLRNNGQECPICQSDNMEYGAFDTIVDVICGNCGAEWTDYYKLSDVTINGYPTRD